jgi:hypothetical protein
MGRNHRRCLLTAAVAISIAAAVLSSPAGSGAATPVWHLPIGPFIPRTVHAVPARPGPVAVGGQRITGHPDVLAAVNAARARLGWPAVRYGNNLAAEACALSSSRCNGVQWGGCPLTPLPGERYTLTIGTAVSNGPRGCVQAISYSSFG